MKLKSKRICENGRGFPTSIVCLSEVENGKISGSFKQGPMSQKVGHDKNRAKDLHLQPCTSNIDLTIFDCVVKQYSITHSKKKKKA